MTMIAGIIINLTRLLQAAKFIAHHNKNTKGDIR